LHDERCACLGQGPEFGQASSTISNHRERTDRPLPDKDSVALMFRRERIVRMRDLSEVADQLKIREFYLQAIEDGAFEDLPDGTYAVGFVRAYADFLSLDSAQIVERFKSEVAKTEKPRLPPMPAFLADKRGAPSGAVLLISLLLVASTYAGWVYRSSPHQTLARWVQEAPASSLAVGRE
jgi:cytoskeleton protein RodZ